VFWNTARLKMGWEPIARQIQNKSSPLMGFVEAGPDDSAARARWQRDFPEHRAVFFGNGMVLLCQGGVLETEDGALGRGSYYGRADVDWRGERVTVFLVDIHSNPLFSRKETIARLTELAMASTHPVIIMGDFNTPSDSVHFAKLRRTFRNAFEAGGEGNIATWPVPCPVLAIDHIWTNRKFSVQFAKQEWSLQSDHKAVIANLAFSE
jgi:endonuclease/exonuclease/phosphatase family metal-dependent hydrolase